MHFLPDTDIFKENNDFHYEILSKRLRELSFLNNGVRIRLLDERSGKEEDFAGAGGVKGFVEYVNRGKQVLHPNAGSVGQRFTLSLQVTSSANVAPPIVTPPPRTTLTPTPGTTSPASRRS